MWVGLFTFCFLLSAILLAWTVMLTWRLTAPAGRKSFRHRLSSWAIKGLLAPLLLWFLMNIGLSFSLQPYMPQVQAAQYRGGNWGPAFMRVLAGGGFVICSFWSAVTLGWRLFAAGAALDGDQRSSFKASCWTCF